MQLGRTCCWVSPQIKFLAGSGIETDRGILDRLLQTQQMFMP
jgi:hypothetical protein